ncbi:MAG: flavodoxin family protein [Christensenellales bacterium]
MKTAIVYYSRHHGNTKKLVDAIAAENDVHPIDVTARQTADLTQYDRIGFASGIYYGSFAKQVLAFARECLPEKKDVFFLQTYGVYRKGYLDAIRSIAREKGCKELGAYGCPGFDTFGPFKLIGGVAKGHPTEQEIKNAAEFYRHL